MNDNIARYQVKPSPRADWMVVDTKKQIAVGYRKSRQEAEQLCAERNHPEIGKLFDKLSKA